MNLDSLARRTFPALICVAIGTVAYFQARGIGALVAAEVQPNSPVSVAPAAVARIPDDAVDADPILERNPFDSEADAKPIVLEVEEEDDDEDAPVARAVSDAPCNDAFTTLVVGSEDPSYSFAAVKPKTGDRELVRVGDSIGGRKVARIGWQRVWLTGGAGACVMKLGEKPTFAGRRTPRRRGRSRTRRRRRGRRRAPVLSPTLKKKITKLGPFEYQVERSLVGELLQKQTELLRRTKVRPVKRGGQVVGMRMYRVRSGTLLHELGIRNGDVVSKINGFDLTNPQKALEAYGRLQSADELKISVERKGKPQTISIGIQ